MIADTTSLRIDLPVFAPHAASGVDQLELIGSTKRLDEVWRDIQPLLDNNTLKAHGELTSADLYVMGLTLKAQFAVRWVDGKPSMVVVWEYLRYPRFTAANILALSGKGSLTFMSQYWGFVTDIMREQGASIVECSTYKQMADLMEKRYDFELTYYHMRKKLGGK